MTTATKGKDEGGRMKDELALAFALFGLISSVFFKSFLVTGVWALVRDFFILHPSAFILAL